MCIIMRRVPQLRGDWRETFLPEKIAQKLSLVKVLRRDGRDSGRALLGLVILNGCTWELIIKLRRKCCEGVETLQGIDLNLFSC